MTILLIGGGSGGHITPLLAVARELKRLRPEIKLVAVCEQNAKFLHLYKEEKAIDGVRQISAGKYRRYSGLSAKDRLTDGSTVARNIRDVGRTVKGYFQAKKLLKELKPDAILVKGGFVAVPVGRAAANLGIPYLTHDSDSIPGLANRLIAKKASLHATGLPAELYSYPKTNTVFTGIPIASEYSKINDKQKSALRDELGLLDCDQVIAVVGGSQGGEQLNEDMVKVAALLMQKHNKLGVIHVAGKNHEKKVASAYDGVLLSEERKRVVVRGFVSGLHRYTAAADFVVTRASATAIAEFAAQRLAIVVVPGRLAGAHQEKNAEFLQKHAAAEVVAYGDSDGLHKALEKLLNNKRASGEMAEQLHKLARPNAAKELAELTINLAEK